MVCEYLLAISRGRWPVVKEHLSDLLSVLPRLPNSMTTSTWYSRVHLEVAEHAVLTITTDNFAPPADVLRSMPASEIASRREALAEVRGRLIAWGQQDWGP